MSATIEAGATGSGADEQITIWPHRSLSCHGKRLLLGAVGAVFAMMAIRAGMLGLWPMTLSATLGFGILAIALRANDRSARMAQVIELGSDTIRFREVGPASRSGTVAEFNPYWVRVIDVTDPPGGPRVLLRQSGRSVAVGDFLSPDERKQLAADLRERIRAHYAVL